MTRLLCCALLVVNVSLLPGQDTAPAVPHAESASLIPKDLDKGYAPMTVLHADSSSLLYKFLLRETCPDLTYCYRPLLARVSTDLQQTQVLAVDLDEAGGIQTYFTINQLGDRVNVYYRQQNWEMGRIQYTASSFRAGDLSPIEEAVAIGSVATDARGQVAGAHFRTNTHTGQLATLLQDMSRDKDHPAPIRTVLFDSLHQVLWKQELSVIEGYERLDVVDAMVRDDGSVAALIQVLDTADNYLVVATRDGIRWHRIAVEGTAELYPWLDYQQGPTRDLYVFGKYFTKPGGGSTGLFVMKFDPTDLTLEFTSKVPVGADGTGNGLKMAASDATANGSGLLDHLGSLRFLPTPDGGGYLTGGYFRAGGTPGANSVRYGTLSVLRFTADGACAWVRNLYRSIEWSAGVSIQEQAGVHQVGNDLFVLFNQHSENAPLTASPLKNLTSIPAMESVLFRISPENDVSRRNLLSYKLDRTILVPPVTSLSANGKLLYAAIEKPLGYRKIYSFNLNW